MRKFDQSGHPGSIPMRETFKMAVCLNAKLCAPNQCDQIGRNFGIGQKIPQPI
jgi:hypothetical protein